VPSSPPLYSPAPDWLWAALPFAVLKGRGRSGRLSVAAGLWKHRRKGPPSTDAEGKRASMDVSVRLTEGQPVLEVCELQRKRGQSVPTAKGCGPTSGRGRGGQGMLGPGSKGAHSVQVSQLACLTVDLSRLDKRKYWRSTPHESRSCQADP
jgi:hypothetical protein